MSSEIPILGGGAPTTNFDDDEQVTTTTNLHGRAGRAIIRKTVATNPLVLPLALLLVRDDEDYSHVAEHLLLSGRSGPMDIRVQQRSGRKTLTTVQGLPKDLDPKKVLKVFKKEFACNGCVVDDEEMGEVIQLQGDHRAKISTLLVEEGICKKDEIQIHGF